MRAPTHRFSVHLRLITMIFLAIVAHGTMAMAQTPAVNTSTGMTLSGSPLALRGYDPVSYFENGRAELGSAEHELAHEGATYRFRSAAHRDRFAASPERFLPQFGGFCAYGISAGAKFDGDPEVWKIVDGKLYLNLNPAIQKTWEEDIAGNIAKAVKLWPSLRQKEPSAL